MVGRRWGWGEAAGGQDDAGATAESSHPSSQTGSRVYTRDGGRILKPQSLPPCHPTGHTWSFPNNSISWGPRSQTCEPAGAFSSKPHHVCLGLASFLCWRLGPLNGTAAASVGRVSDGSLDPWGVHCSLILSSASWLKAYAVCFDMAAPMMSHCLIRGPKQQDHKARLQSPNHEQEYIFLFINSLAPDISFQ